MPSSNNTLVLILHESTGGQCATSKSCPSVLIACGDPNLADIKVGGKCISIEVHISIDQTDCRYIIPHDPKTARFDYRTEEAVPVFPQTIRPAKKQDVTAKKV